MGSWKTGCRWYFFCLKHFYIFCLLHIEQFTLNNPQDSLKSCLMNIEKPCKEPVLYSAPVVNSISCKEQFLTMTRSHLNSSSKIGYDPCWIRSHMWSLKFLARGLHSILKLMGGCNFPSSSSLQIRVKFTNILLFGFIKVNLFWIYVESSFDAAKSLVFIFCGSWDVK